MTRPGLYLYRMMLFLVAVAVVAALLRGALTIAFSSNPLLNTLILVVLLTCQRLTHDAHVGEVTRFEQVVRDLLGDVTLGKQHEVLGHGHYCAKETWGLSSSPRPREAVDWRLEWGGSSQTTPVERLESSAWIECEESSWCGPSSSPSSCSCSSGGAT